MAWKKFGKNMSKIHFVSFVTEGHPYDRCLDLTSQMHLIQKNLSPFFSTVHVYTPRTIRSLEGNQNVCLEYEEWSYPPMNAGGQHMGYWDWKPFIMHHRLLSIDEGDILIYNDSNFEKYGYLESIDWENFQILAEDLLSKTDIFLSQEVQNLKVKGHVKRYTAEKILKEPSMFTDIGERNLLSASRVLVRNTDFSRNLVSRWNDLCQDKSLIFREPNPNPHPDFRWGCADQSILNVLLYEKVFEKEIRSDAFDIYYDNRIWKETHKIHNPQ